MRVVHIFRSPVGGLFRHVADLVEAQSDAGIDTGIICDTIAGGDYSDRLLDKLRERCNLGLVRMAMPRMPALVDLLNVGRVAAHARTMTPDILHGHGSKGGLYARLAARKLGVPSIYTPHGGVLNYEWSSFAGKFFLGTEKILARAGSGFAFVCAYERDTFDRKIGIHGKPFTVVHNGLWPREFQPVTQRPDATDLLFAGEMRYNKGVDLLLQALVELNTERPTTLTLAGDGVQFEEYKALAENLGLKDKVRFIGRVPIQEAFAMGRIFVLPSRFESFPYVIMEAVAAELPIVSTSVGGIPEVLPGDMLTTDVTAPALATSIRRTLASLDSARNRAHTLADTVKQTTTAKDMADRICELYRQLLKN